MIGFVLFFPFQNIGNRSCIVLIRKGISGRREAPGQWSFSSTRRQGRSGWLCGRRRRSRSALIILVGFMNRIGICCFSSFFFIDLFSSSWDFGCHCFLFCDFWLWQLFHPYRFKNMEGMISRVSGMHLISLMENWKRSYSVLGSDRLKVSIINWVLHPILANRSNHLFVHGFMLLFLFLLSL